MSDKPKLTPLQKWAMIQAAVQALMQANKTPSDFFDKPDEIYKPKEEIK